MELAVGLAALAIIALVVVVFQNASDRGDLLNRLAEERKAWEVERLGLITRIQHPERVPVTHSTGQVRDLMTPEARQAFHRTGTVAPQIVNDGDN